MPRSGPKHDTSLQAVDGAAVSRAAAQWQHDGWVLVEGLVPRDEIRQALDELQAASPSEPSGPTRRADTHASGAAFRAAQFDGTTLFPVPDCPALNRLFVHPNLVAFAQAALTDTDLRLYQSRVWSKSGGHTNYEQPLHRDGNHALIPIINQPGWWHLECFLYLTDVDETNGAPRLVPRELTRGTVGRGRALSRDDAPEMFASEVSAPGPAGSLLAYRSDVWHRGTNLKPGTQRHVLVIGFKPASVEWIGFDSHAPLVNSPDFVHFASGSNPDELALFGVPRPGHRYWTAEILDVMASMYPGLDLAPWRSALPQ